MNNDGYIDHDTAIRRIAQELNIPPKAVRLILKKFLFTIMFKYASKKRSVSLTRLGRITPKKMEKKKKEVNWKKFY